jgi:aminoglycoside 6'-N-acetyltransferase
MTAEDFGARRPSARQQWFRRLGARLPKNYVGRRLASLLLGPAGGRANEAFDVDVFGTERARLHPSDNICEKRVYLMPQFWEAEERAFLAEQIAAHPFGSFVFVDVGANVGLWTLFARSAARAVARRLRAIAVEPDSDMRARFAFNLAASGAADDVRVFPCAVSERAGRMKFSVNAKSRGTSRIDAAGAIEVEARTLLSIVKEAGLTRIDALKIDIEGHEFEALEAFFRLAPPAILPESLILETAHEAPERSIRVLAVATGYEEALRTRMNAVLVRPTPRLRRAVSADAAILEGWDRAPHVIAGTTDDPEAANAFEGISWPEELAAQSAQSEYLIGEIGGRPIGAMQIIDPHLEPTHYWGEVEPHLRAIDIWIGEKDELGKGHGERMMRLALARSFAEPKVDGVVIDPLASNVRAHTFYQRLGFRPEGRRLFNQEDDCLVHRLTREEWRRRFPDD